MGNIVKETLYSGSGDTADHSLLIQAITPDLITFTVPFNRYGLLPLGGRTNVLILRRATKPGIFVVPSHPCTKATRETIDFIERETGLRVRWLVTPSGSHVKYINQWVHTFPEALFIGTIGTEGSIAENKQINWANDCNEFEPEVSIHPVFSHRNRELAIIHHASGSLLTADLILNLPATIQYMNNTSVPLLAKFIGLSHRLRLEGCVYRILLKRSLTAGPILKKELASVLAESFDRIVPCHGDVIEQGGKEIFIRQFSRYT